LDRIERRSGQGPPPIAVILGVILIASGFVAMGCWCFGR